MATAAGPILVVEDSAVQRVMLQRLLQEAGYTVLAARDGLEGLALAQEQRPALVITDIAMPNMDGYAMCRAIKEDARLQSIPVLLLTGLDDPREVVRGLEVGADNYLTKPVEDAHLLERIELLLTTPLQDGAGQEVCAPFKISFAGEEHEIRVSRRQTVNLLLSTYENAVRKNRELIQAKQALSLLTDHLEQEVTRRTQQLEVASRVKSEFIANMSHEVRTPMNAIIGMTDLVLALELTDQQRELLGIARTAADKLLQLLNSLLDFSRLEEGKLTLKLDQLSLRQLLEGVGNRFLEAARGKGLSFYCRLAAGLPDRLIGDAECIAQVVGRLLDNAVKFTERGGVSLEVTAQGWDAEQVTLLFAVADSGIGIDAEQQEWIFESFTQGDGSRTRKYGGSGLGLTLAKRLAEAMGGRLYFQSEQGRGSLFSLQVTLPYDSSSMADSAPVGGEGVWQTLLQTGGPGVVVGALASEPSLLAECHRLLGLCEQAIHAERLTEVDHWVTPLRQAAGQFFSASSEDFEQFSGNLLRMAISARNRDGQKAAAYLERARVALTS
ncbi:MAG: response regulator [Magnetococcales bacterium]|nr:response regulator [Magnetococcales bacterium]MBF0113819.1 response regulator [Magnetococcales bacterium]